MPLKVAEGIYLLDTVGLGFSKTIACYLIAGDKKALIDPGYSSSIPILMKELEGMGLSITDIDYIIPTHLHADHAGAVGEISKMAKGAKIVAHERAAKHLVDPTKLILSIKQTYGESVFDYFGRISPVEQERVEVASDGDSLDLGGIEISFFYTPGHAPHQFSIIEHRNKSIITGDAVGISYPDFGLLIPTTPPPSFDLNLALRSLKKVKDLDARSLLTPHFGRKEPNEAYFRLNEKSIVELKEDVERMARLNMNLDEIVSSLHRKVASKAGVKLAEVPMYVLNSIRISVMGMLKYIKEI